MKALPVAAIFLALAAISPSPANAQPGHADPAKDPAHAKDAAQASGIVIHQEIYFNVPPARLYQALLSSEQFSASTKRSFDMFTAASAKIDAREGGVFSVFDGHIIGRILELVPGKRIVEAWRVVDWPEGVYSIARFDLEAKGDGTQLRFDHIGFPEGLKEHLANGWQEHYWDALGRYFRER